MSHIPFIAAKLPHTLRWAHLRAVDMPAFVASGCATRRADGVPAFLA